ncbi:hypothetical protein T459_15776 [Capsicum annuum]|uniref:Uncharacterized protein n=1 Tax=Capsicum annuum TaxID=4072 RepID=A0A2G2Z6Y8_CAPAN|nr:hypothetical protein T459_15776 [Capsicum annuum]
MEKQGEIEKGKANNFAVSFSALRKDVVNVLDFMERLKNEKDIMTGKRQEVDNLLRPILDDVDNTVRCKYNVDHVLPSLMDNIDECISSCHHSTSSATMTDEQLNFLLLNLHHMSKYRAEKIFPLETQYEILQNVCGNVRDFDGLKVNGCVEHEIIQFVLPQFKLMAERVALFLWDD